jgi:hypothetical protein
MKTRIRIFTASMALICIVVLVMFISARKSVPAFREAGRGTNRAVSTSAVPNLANATSQATNERVVRPNTTAPAGRELTKGEEYVRGLTALNHVDIAFYGKVEDQDGNALPDTRVPFSIMYNTGLKAGVLTNETRTDAKGYFTISGYKGKSLSVVPEKPGYVLASTNGGGVYSHMWSAEKRIREPDPANPVVITMWKLRGGEELIDLQKTYKIRFEKSSFEIDFLNGRIVDSGGDIRIDVSRRSPTENGPSYPWIVRIKPIDGGIMQVPMQAFHMTFEAPAEGYHAEFAETQLGRIEGFTKPFFIKSRNGQVFSKLVLSFWADPTVQGETRISILQGLANAHGSRNWEVDPKLVRKPGSAP